MREALLEEIPIASKTQKKFTDNWKRFRETFPPHLPALVLDAEGTIRHLTPAARRMLEYKGDQLVDSCFFAHVHSKHLYQVMRDVADMVCYGKAHASWLVRLKTGQGRWQWFKAIVSNELSGPDAAITITLRDVHDP